MRELTNDPRGTADWIEREARGMDPMQLYREFVQNGIEAGATRIVIDGWTDPETGHRLARITDNGNGLTPRELIERLSCLHGKFKGDTNYGVGARIAALPSNHAGLTFASRTATTEAMMTLHKAHGKFGVKAWEVEDDDGDTISVETVLPDTGMLDRLPDNATGTAVILHGNGHEDTWDTIGTAHSVHKFLTRRYYDFTNDATIQVIGVGRVIPVGEYFATHADTEGEIPFHNVAGLDGTMFWWIIPSSQEARATIEGTRVVPGGVGLVVENEIFDYAQTYLGDFGLVYRSVQARVGILIFVDGAEMGTARADLVLPGENRKNIPWKKLGAHFAANMPAEIETLLSQVTVNSASLNAEIAKMLDADWMRKLNPTKVTVPSREGEPSTGDDAGNATPPGEDIEHEKRGVLTPRKKRHAAERQNTGDNPGKTRDKVLTPQVVFDDPELFDRPNHPFGIYWNEVSNTIHISRDFPPFIREIDRWCEKVQHPRQLITLAVESAYGVEFAATIVDANAQSKWELSPELIDQLKADAALYAKALGMQALTQRIESYIKDAARNA